MSKISTDALNRFAELHPERFAELQKQAEEGTSQPSHRQFRQYPTHFSTGAIPTEKLPRWFREGKTVEEAIAQARGDNNHYLITTPNHRFFEGALTPEEAVEKAKQHSQWDGPVTSIEEMQ